MLGFGTHAPNARCGLIIDVNSASVSAAIVVSEPDEPSPTVVWTHIERCAIQPEFEISFLAKQIATTLLNVSLEIGGAGLTALAKHDAKQRIKYTQVSVGAPWSYTVTKQVTFKPEKVTTVTRSLLSDLIATAERETTETCGSNPLFAQLGLEVIGSVTTGMTANGYTVSTLEGKEVSEFSLTRQLTICQKQVLNTVDEVHTSIAANSELSVHSYISNTLSQVLQSTNETDTYGVIDMSGNATEVGLIQAGTLTQVSHDTWGYYDVTRELHAITLQPLEACFAMIQDDHIATSASAAKTEVTEAFAEKIAALITRACEKGDMPHHFLIHTDTHLHTFAEQVVKKSLRHCTKQPCTVSIISEKLADRVTIKESRLALSTAVFHTSVV